MKNETKKQNQNQIASIRKLRNFNRKKVASDIGHKTTATVGYWETGYKVPTLRNALKLQIILGARIDQIFPGLVSEVEDELIKTGFMKRR